MVVYIFQNSIEHFDLRFQITMKFRKTLRITDDNLNRIGAENDTKMKLSHQNTDALGQNATERLGLKTFLFLQTILNILIF